MKDRLAGMAASCRALRAMARIMLCLALVLLPVAGVSAAHFESGAAAAQGHHESPDPSAPDAPAPLCHQLGACHAFVTPPALCLARGTAAALAVIAAVRMPASAVVHRLLRPPIGARA